MYNFEKFTGYTESIYGIAQSSNGKYFLSKGDDDKAILWDENGKIIFSINAHERSVNDVAFSADNQNFITDGSDQTFII